MKRGLVIGRFLPLHRGHLALIKFASNNCDHLTISMSYKISDPIPGELRLEWLKAELKDYSAVTITASQDDFDDEAKVLKDRLPMWVRFLKKKFSPFDVVFSSEEYGVALANELGIPHIMFDPKRNRFPVSGSAILAHPLRNWEFIAQAAKPYFVKKICFYGPESTGKSTLARKMAEIYQTEFVPEVSREFISSNDFTIDDIIRIGQAQTDRVFQKAKRANKFLFCDTDLITTQIYCRHYLGEVPPILFELEKKISYERYFLFDVDVPWVADGLRDLGERRVEMRDVFRQELDIRKIPFTLISGTYAERERSVRLEVDRMLVSG